MSEWYCGKCGRLNTSSDPIAGRPAICHNCKHPITYDPAIEDLKEQKENCVQELKRISRELDFVNDMICSLEDDLSSYQIQRDEIIAERKEAAADLKEIETKLSDKKTSGESYLDLLSEDENQQKLGAFV